MRCIISEFHVVETEFKDEECLIGALQDVGYTPEVHEKEVKLNGYNGRGKQPKAHIVVRKGQFGGYGDAGFERVADGNFKLHADDYDYGRGRADKVKVKKVTQMKIEVWRNFYSKDSATAFEIIAQTEKALAQ